MTLGRKIKYFLQCLSKVSKTYIILTFLTCLVDVARVSINVILPKFLIDELMGNCDATMLLIWGGSIIGSNLLFAFFTKTMDRLLTIKRILVSREMERDLSTKIVNVDYQHLENPHYLDMKDRARFAINNQGALVMALNYFVAVLRNIFTIISMIAIMFTLSWVLVVTVSIAIIAILLIKKGFSKFELGFYQELIPINRRVIYYGWDSAFEAKGQKEYRLFGMQDTMMNKFKTYNDALYLQFKRYYNAASNNEGIIKILTVLQSAIAYLYVGLRCITDALGPRISIGSMTMYVNATINFGNTFRMLGENVILLIQNLNFLEPYFEVMNMPESVENGGNIEFDGIVHTIRFENVDFTYPRTTKKILDQVSFEIKEGEKISIVGLNGAGKTTLVKLLCRLYRPDSGTIYVNDIDINEYELISYVKGISAVFQDYKLFAFSIEENVSCQAVGADTDRVAKVLTDVGMKEKIDSLQQGVQTLLGKDYDQEGIEMSGGQNQKVAIARALYKNASLVILDEPTSALDPISEAEIYEQFNSMVGSKTALYISHRMSSSVFCDKILILDGGKVADFDSHKNLMKKTSSLYYKLFTTQAKNYQLKKEA